MSLQTQWHADLGSEIISLQSLSSCISLAATIVYIFLKNISWTGFVFSILFFLIYGLNSLGLSYVFVWTELFSWADFFFLCCVHGPTSFLNVGQFILFIVWAFFSATFLFFFSNVWFLFLNWPFMWATFSLGPFFLGLPLFILGYPFLKHFDLACFCFLGRLWLGFFFIFSFSGWPNFCFGHTFLSFLL